MYFNLSRSVDSDLHIPDDFLKLKYCDSPMVFWPTALYYPRQVENKV